METKFFVAQAYRYAESKNWEWKLVGEYDTLEVAKQAFHERCGAIMKPSNDFAMVILYDSFGNKVDSDFKDTHVEEIQPEE